MILEHVNRLTDFGHQVYVYCNKKGKPTWFDVDKRVKWFNSIPRIKGVDVLVITSPHTIDIAGLVRAKRTVLFCQMAEHLFLHHDPDKRARQRFAEIGGVDPKLVEDTVMSLKQHEFLYIRRRDGAMCVIEP